MIFVPTDSFDETPYIVHLDIERKKIERKEIEHNEIKNYPDNRTGHAIRMRNYLTSDAMCLAKINTTNYMKTNQFYDISWDHDPENRNNCDILWFEELILHQKHINEQQFCVIDIGDMVVWRISIDLLLKLNKPKLCGTDISITIPKYLFMNTLKFFHVIDEFIGIPLISLQYHKIRFKFMTSSSFEYKLRVKSIYVNNLGNGYNYRCYFAQLPLMLNINKICNYNATSTTNYPICVSPKIMHDAINSKRIISYIKNIEHQKRKSVLLNLPILIDNLYDIIAEYDIDNDNNSLHFTFSDHTKKHGFILEPKDVCVTSGMYCDNPTPQTLAYFHSRFDKTTT